MKGKNLLQKAKMLLLILGTMLVSLTFAVPALTCYADSQDAFQNNWFPFESTEPTKADPDHFWQEQTQVTTDRVMPDFFSHTETETSAPPTAPVRTDDQNDPERIARELTIFICVVTAVVLLVCGIRSFLMLNTIRKDKHDNNKS